MKKELIGIIVCMLLVGTVLPSISGKLLKNDIKKNSNLFNEYILDQYQENFCPDSGSIIDIDQKLAQSFKPTLDNLAKIDLAIRRFPLTNESLTISIREDLDGSNLISFSIPASQISDSSNSWNEFILTEVISLVPENTYYIVIETEDFAGYCWGSNFSNLYGRGCCWYYVVDDGYWKHVSDEDLAFRTYGINQPPNFPRINGPGKLKVNEVGTFIVSAIDPDGDQVYFFIDWNDGNTVDWDGPYPSGKEVQFNHSWIEKQTMFIITVQAKDTNGLKGNATALVVLIPRIRTSCDCLWLRFFNMFPILKRILDYIL